MTTNIEFLSQLKKHTGLVTILRQFETVLKVSCEEDVAAILVDTFRYEETTREFRFKERGTRLISFKRCTDDAARYGRWYKVGEMVVWDETFEPFIQAKFGRSVSPREYAEQREWERNCYRPGNSRNPLDNYARVLAGPTTPEMERYW